jgi:hypothetical protein
MKFYLLGTMRTCILKQLVLLTVFFISVSGVHAEPITFRYEGTLTDVDAPLQGTFSAGDSFFGTYTFDSDSPGSSDHNDPGDQFLTYHFNNAVSAMSFNSGNYKASATTGIITQDVDFGDGMWLYSVSFDPVSGSPVGDFVLDTMSLSWLLPAKYKFLDVAEILVQPRFDPNLPPFENDPFDDFFDVDGNLVYSPTEGLVGNPDQPLFFFDGTPAPPGNGSFAFSFLGSEGQVSSIGGKLDSVTVAINTEDGLVAHWPLNEGSGVIVDDTTGNGFDGVLKRGPAWHGEDLLFDGIDDYVDAGEFEVSGEALTLTAWVYPDQLGNCRANDCRIISKSTSTAEQDHVWMLSTIKVGDQTRLRFRLKTNGSTSTLIASSGDMVDGELFHAAATYDGVTMRLYKNGLEVGSLAKTGSINDPFTATTSQGVWIGGNPEVAISRPWKGLISDVRVYQKALTGEELEAVMEVDAEDGDSDTP